MLRNFLTLADRPLPEALARSLRHEVGDFLQSVYATVAILQKRLPVDAPEQRILRDLRQRSEVCRQQLELVHDFACPLELNYDSTDLADLANNLVRKAAIQYPEVDVAVETFGPVHLRADPRRLITLGELLLTNACTAPARHVRFRAAPGSQPGEVEWEVTDDGPGLPDEYEQHLFRPFFTTKAGHLGLGLALARKLVHLHGGRISAGNRAEGGFRVHMVFPEEPPTHLIS